MFFRYAILGLISVHCLWAVCLGQDLCEGYDPNHLPDPNVYACDGPLILDNGDLESGCSYLTEFDFLPPISWQRIPHPSSNRQDDCYAGLHNSFIPESINTNWSIDYPYEGENFVVLSTSGFSDKDGEDRIGDSDIKGSSMSQNVFLSAGDTIRGAFFFGTVDYQPFNDWGQISLIFAGDPNDYPDSDLKFALEASYCDVEIVGNYLSTLDIQPETGGWIQFTYTVEPNQVGPYLLICEVADDGDSIINSYYAVDGLYICKGGIRPADLNSDCEVNLEDFSIISEAWLSFCPDDPNGLDPNDFTTDPNIPCQLADINNDWYVDVNDLIFMTDDWLYNAAMPVFLENPILLETQIDVSISATLIDHVSYPKPEDLIFSLLEGPDWLTVEADGTLSGTPTLEELGENQFIIQVDNPFNTPVQSTLVITVVDQ